MDFQNFPYPRSDLVLLFNLYLKFFTYKIENLDSNSIQLIWDISGLSGIIHMKCLKQSLAQRKSSININIDEFACPRVSSFRRLQDLTEINGGIFQQMLFAIWKQRWVRELGKGDPVLSFQSSKVKFSAMCLLQFEREAQSLVILSQPVLFSHKVRSF